MSKKNIVLFFSFLFLVFFSLLYGNTVSAYTTRVSLTNGGGQGNQHSYNLNTNHPTFYISNDGRYVYFWSNASNLVASDTNGSSDIFMRDRLLGTTTRINLNASGQQLNSNTRNFSLSPDGRYLVFTTSATNAVAGDTNGVVDVFVRDLVSGTVVMASLGSGGVLGNADAENQANNVPKISDDGRYVLFFSLASNLVPGDTSLGEYFVRDILSGTTVFASVDNAGNQFIAQSNVGSLSADGKIRTISVSGQGIYRRNITSGTGVTIRIDRNSAGGNPNAVGGRPDMSADGRYIVYDSTATNAVAGDTNGVGDIFMYDVQTNTTTLISKTPTGGFPNGASNTAKISRDGTKIVFTSSATNLVSGDIYSGHFMYDRITNTTKRISIPDLGGTPNNVFILPAYMSYDGSHAIWASQASNIVSGDTNNLFDVFVFNDFSHLFVAPTKNSSGDILDTTFTVTGETAINASGISIVTGSGLATATGLSCIQVSAQVVTCGVIVTSSGDLSLRLTDIYGGSKVVTESNYVIDNIAPLIPTIITPTSGSYRGNNNPTISGTGEPGTIFTVTTSTGIILGTGIVDGSGNRSKLLTLSEGLYTLNVNLIDRVGNTSPAASTTFTIIYTTITITAPTILLNTSITDTIITLSGAVGVTTTGVNILGSTTAPYSNLLCTQISPTLVTCTISIDDDGLLRVRGIDNHGNSTTTAQQSYIVDTVAPDVPSVSVNTESPNSINNPEITIDSRDDIALDYCEMHYFEDDGGAGLGNLKVDTIPASNLPFSLYPNLDPDNLTNSPYVHEILVRCYDRAGNISDNIVKFPPIIEYLAPVTISNVPINGVQVKITSPLGNDIDNIHVSMGSVSLSNCVGSGGDTIAPYASPVICDMSTVSSTEVVQIQAEDVVLGAVGQNSQQFIIDTDNPTSVSFTVESPYIYGITGASNYTASGSRIVTIMIRDAIAIMTGGVSISTNNTTTYHDLQCTQINGGTIQCTVIVDDDGVLVLRLQDIAGNVDDNVNVGTYVIDTVPPVLTFTTDIGSGSTTGRYFEFTATDDILLDTGSYIYGFSSDALCDSGDSYTVGATGDLITTEAYNGQYICIRAMDVMGNYGYAVSTNPLLIDITAPVVTLNSGSFITIPHNGSYIEYGARRTDAIDGSGTNVVISGTVNTSVVGIYTIEYRYTDHAGNISSIVTRTVNVTDQTPPVVTLNGLATFTVAQGTGFTDLGANWTDAVDGAGVVNPASSGSVNTGVVGTYILEYRYTDMGGNISNIVTRTVNVTDQTPPVVTLNGSGTVIVAHGGVYNESGATWTDNVDGAGTVVIISGSVNTNVVGTYVLEYIYVDAGGNTGSVIRTVNVIDQTPPVVTLNGSGTVIVAHGGVYNESGATWTDNVDGAGTVVIISGSVNTNVVGTYVLEYIYVDAGGNTGSVIRTVNVTDQTPPVVTLNGGSAITVVSGTPYDELGATWTDNVDGTGIVVIISGTVNTGVVGTYVVSYTYIDHEGNVSAPVTRTVNVIPATVAGGGGGSNPTKDNCPDGDYSSSYYDGQCGTKPVITTGMVTTGNLPITGGVTTGGVETGTLPVISPEVFEGNSTTGNACPYVDYKMQSFLGLKTEAQKRRFIVCWLYTNKQTMFDQVIPFDYDRIATREEASRMIGNFVKEVLNKDPIRKRTDKICRFTDLNTARPGLVPYIKQSCEYGVFNGTYDHEFLPNEWLNQAHAIATVLRASYGYQDEQGNEPWFLPYTNLIQEKDLERRGFTVPETDLMNLYYKGMTRGNLGEFMYRVAVDIFNHK